MGSASTRVLWLGGGVLGVVMVVHLVALAVTGGPVTGPVSLRNPATFAETGWLVAWSVVLMRGGAAGTAGVFLVGVVVLLVVALRSGGLPSVRLGVTAGVVVLLAGCLVGLVMVFNNSGVYQGSVGESFTRATGAYLGPDAATVGRQYVLLRPFTDGGDLVLPHAIGVHGLLLLAVPAVLLARTRVPGRRQPAVTAVASGGVLVGLAVLLQHALRQLPLSALSPGALAALVVCAVALLASYAVVGLTLVRHRKGN